MTTPAYVIVMLCYLWAAVGEWYEGNNAMVWILTCYGLSLLGFIWLGRS